MSCEGCVGAVKRVLTKMEDCCLEFLCTYTGNNSSLFFRESCPLGARPISTQVVRNWMKSVKNIQKITKAMKMVAASKLRAVQVRTENSRGLWKPFTALLGDVPTLLFSNDMVEQARKFYIMFVLQGQIMAVLSISGNAEPLTSDHRPSRKDERERIENLGGYMHFSRGLWRLQGSLAVSRGIGDSHLKQWVIPDPKIKVLTIKPEFEFLILAFDGLWDKQSGGCRFSSALVYRP